MIARRRVVFVGRGVGPLILDDPGESRGQSAQRKLHHGVPAPGVGWPFSIRSPDLHGVRAPFSSGRPCHA